MKKFWKCRLLYDTSVQIFYGVRNDKSSKWCRALKDVEHVNDVEYLNDVEYMNDVDCRVFIGWKT